MAVELAVVPIAVRATCGRARARRPASKCWRYRRGVHVGTALAIFPTFLAMPVASSLRAGSRDFGQRPSARAVRFVAWGTTTICASSESGYWTGASLSESLTVRIIPEALTRAAEFLAAGSLSSGSRSARRRNGSRSIPMAEA